MDSLRYLSNVFHTLVPFFITNAIQLGVIILYTGGSSRF